MARHPSAYAPTAEEVLHPPPVPLPTVPMLDEERRLINDVLANPDADEPRLRFAEWVEQSDPARAQFIRSQLTDRGERTAGTHPEPCRRLADVFLPWGARDVVFRRGFAEAMSLTGRSFISLSDGLFAATPLRDVRLIAVNFLMADLVRCPNLAKLVRLSLRGNQIGAEGVAHLAGCPYLVQLESLDLARNGLSDDAAEHILAARWSRTVRVIDLTDNRFRASARETLTNAFRNRVLL